MSRQVPLVTSLILRSLGGPGRSVDPQTEKLKSKRLPHFSSLLVRIIRHYTHSQEVTTLCRLSLYIEISDG